MFSSRRLLNKIGVMKIEDLDILKQKVKDFIDWFRHFVIYEVWPEGNYEEIITRCWNHVNITNRIIKAIKYLEIFIQKI